MDIHHVLFFAVPQLAGEFSDSAEDTHRSGNGTGNSWQMEYREEVAKHVEASFTYLNEGHFTGHHRDGHGVQLWARGTLLDRRLSIAAGTGPYLYYDTTPALTGNTEVDRHGLALLSSLAATWRLDDRLLLQLRVNNVASSNSIDTVAALVGSDTARIPRREGPDPNRTVTATGHTARNRSLFSWRNHFSPRRLPSFAAAIEYKSLSMRYRVERTLLYEGESIERAESRHQLWPKIVLNNVLLPGVGAAILSIDTLGKAIISTPCCRNGTSAYHHPNGSFFLEPGYQRYYRDSTSGWWGSAIFL